MARVEFRQSGGHTYAVAVHDYQVSDGSWRKKTRSFGNADDPDHVRRAHEFVAAVNAGQSFLEADFNVNRDKIVEALGVIVTAGLAAAAIAWLLGDAE